MNKWKSKSTSRAEADKNRCLTKKHYASVEVGTYSSYTIREQKVKQNNTKQNKTRLWTHKTNLPREYDEILGLSTP